MKHGQLLKRMEWVHTHIPFNEIRTDNFIQGQIVAGSDVCIIEENISGTKCGSGAVISSVPVGIFDKMTLQLLVLCTHTASYARTKSFHQTPGYWSSCPFRTIYTTCQGYSP